MTAASRRRVFAVAVVGAVAAAVGLGSYLVVANGRTAKSAKEGGKGKGGGAAVPVTVARALRETVPVRINAIGNVEAFSPVQVKARGDGLITDVNMREGAAVKKNEVLFRIDPRPY